MDPLADQVTALAARPLSAFPGATDINVGFTLNSGYMVFFMQAGFAMLCAGSVRAKNAKNIILLNLLDACFGVFAWWATGFAFAYGDPIADADGAYNFSASQAFIGKYYFFMANLPRSSYWVWFFQFTFAATGATIVSGAVAERCRFECYMLYELMIVMFVYPIVAHWVWSPFGWMSAFRTTATTTTSWTLLFGTGVYDFAGDGPVHMLGGVASLWGAWVLGPRIGRFDAAGNPVEMPGHNASLTLLGVFMLWFGWYGFNPGSTNAILNNASGYFDAGGYSQVVAAAAVNTTISAGAGAVFTLFTSMIHQYMTLGVPVWDLIIAGNGALAGLVGITSGAAMVNTWSAYIIGMTSGFVYYGFSKLMLKLKIDDPVDAIAVHMGCGMWGLIMTSAFSASNMIQQFYGPAPYENTTRAYGWIMGAGSMGGKLLAAHLVYIIVIFGWVTAIMLPFFLIIKKLGLMRVSPEVEALGLDVSHHGGSAYPHDKSTSKGDLAGMSPEMVDRKIDEAIARFKRDMGNGGKVE